MARKYRAGSGRLGALQNPEDSVIELAGLPGGGTVRICDVQYQHNSENHITLFLSSDTSTTIGLAPSPKHRYLTSTAARVGIVSFVFGQDTDDSRI